MGKNLEITKSLESYIEKFSNELDPIQKEIISYNKTLGDIKKMQITTSQCFFLELIIKITGAKNVLEIGTFTGLSALSMALGLPDDGRLITLDKNILTNNIANIFFRKAKQEKKIKTISKPALESIIDLKKKNNFLMLFL